MKNKLLVKFRNQNSILRKTIYIYIYIIIIQVIYIDYSLKLKKEKKTCFYFIFSPWKSKFKLLEGKVKADAIAHN